MENNHTLSLFYCVGSWSKMTLKLAVDGKSAKKAALACEEYCRHLSSVRPHAGETVGT